mgnify:CR=1 FL=1
MRQLDGSARYRGQDYRLTPRFATLSAELEATDLKMASQQGKGDLAPEAKSYFLALGRFAEPRLRRALSLLGNPAYGDAFLTSIATVETHVGTGE